MPAPGRFCLVLHGHLPYVLHHGIFPHGEAWLYEAAAETYLPLIDLLDELAKRNTPVAITLGLTPVLLTQLASKQFKVGFVSYLHDRMDRADADRREFEQKGDSSYAGLAGRWHNFFFEKFEHFRAIDGDIPKLITAHVQAGRIELLTGPITHGYLPLLLHERSIAAQLRAGVATTQRITGLKPTGLWLPECAYRPASPAWKPPVLNGKPFARPGLETHLAAAGLNHFVVDTHLVDHARPLGLINNGKFEETNDALAYWDQRRGWKSPLQAVGVSSDSKPPEVFAFARHPRVSEQVWSSVIGYPGAAEYLDFHTTHGERGLRYRRVTDHATPSSAKSPYDASLVPGRIRQNAIHFCSVVKQTLEEFAAITGRTGTVVAPFDAELFGHWWFEGPLFLREMLSILAADPAVDVVTTAAALDAQPVDKVVEFPEGSWGEGGSHAVWLNDSTRWMWECEYRAETRLLKLVDTLPWQQQPLVNDVLSSAARELLLLQSSDWPFVIHSGGAVDYGVTRFSGHVSRFDRLATIAEKVAAGATLTDVELSEQLEANLHDAAPGDIDLSWFR